MRGESDLKQAVRLLRRVVGSLEVAVESHDCKKNCTFCRDIVDTDTFLKRVKS